MTLMPVVSCLRRLKKPEAVKAINSQFLKEYKQSKTADKLITRFRNFLGQFSSITGIPIPAQPSTVREILKGYGTSGLTAYYSLVGDMPVKNWGGVASLDFPIENAAKISRKNFLRLWVGIIPVAAPHRRR